MIGITHEKTHLELQREPVVAAIPGGRRCTASTIAAVRHDDDQSLLATSDVFGGRSVVGESSPSHKRLPSADREVPLLVL